MNRGVEIAPDVADAMTSLVERQVKAGLVVRMAVLYDLITRPTTADRAAPPVPVAAGVAS